MKRRWLVGRIILAVLLLGLAVLAFYAWPIGPRWKIGAEHPLGFDMREGLLYTGIDNTKGVDGNYELQGYDLATGGRRVVKSIELGKPSRYYRSILSADCSTIACYNFSSPLNPDSSIQVFDVRQQCQQLCRIETGALLSVALSVNGDTLALQKSMAEIEVWNCRTGMILHRLRLPSEALHWGVGGIGFSGPIVCCPQNMQFSSDKHFLAVGTEMQTLTVFDLFAGRSIGHCSHSQIPLFLPDSNVMVTTPSPYQTGKAQWYVLDSEAIKPLSISRPMEVELQGLVASPGLLLMFYWDRATTKTLQKWIPFSLRDKLETFLALGWKNLAYHVTSIDAGSGRTRDNFILRVKNSHPAIEFDNIRVSPDGMLLALKGDAELSLWDIPPRRSFTYWLVCCSVAFLAFWLAWPRKAKVM